MSGGGTISPSSFDFKDFREVQLLLIIDYPITACWDL